MQYTRIYRKLREKRKYQAQMKSVVNVVLIKHRVTSTIHIPTVIAMKKLILSTSGF